MLVHAVALRTLARRQRVTLKLRNSDALSAPLRAQAEAIHLSTREAQDCFVAVVHEEDTHAMFVGVWSNKQGWANGKGRYGMLIVTEVSATGLAKGYYLWGEPTKDSWGRDPAGYTTFQEYIMNDGFSIGGTQVSVKLNNGVLNLKSFKKDKPSEISRIDLRPVWQLVRTGDTAAPSGRQEKPSRSNADRKKSIAETRPAATSPTSGSATMEERYRACRKLVKGFARREACARNGAI